MRTYDLAVAWRACGRRALRLPELRALLDLRSDNGAYKRAERLVAAGVLRRIAKGLYELAGSPASDFEIANLLRAPSYVSLESALNLHGILSQVPYRVTSVTTRMSKAILAGGREYEYSRVKPGAFFGYERREGALVAQPEKALADYLYLASKGLRRRAFEDLDVSILDHRRFHAIVREMKLPALGRYARSVVP